MRFREESLTFKISENADELVQLKTRQIKYPAMTKTLGGFKLHVDAGDYTDSEIIVLLGENGMGKTTFVQMLAGKIKPDNENDAEFLTPKVSYKPQTSQYQMVKVIVGNVFQY
jgi:ATP-binding cassette subfamily E protein 1